MKKFNDKGRKNYACLLFISNNFSQVLYKQAGCVYIRKGLNMLRYRYALTEDGKRRCSKNEFYLQDTANYRGYTEKIFGLLYEKDHPMTAREISELTGIRIRSVNGVITFNIGAGYITRFTLK